MNLAGVMIFSLQADDYNGTCVENQFYPLINAIKKELLK